MEKFYDNSVGKRVISIIEEPLGLFYIVLAQSSRLFLFFLHGHMMLMIGFILVTPFFQKLIITMVFENFTFLDLLIVYFLALINNLVFNVHDKHILLQKQIPSVNIFFGH